MSNRAGADQLVALLAFSAGVALGAPTPNHALAS
jgi:hypothetical protein